MSDKEYSRPATIDDLKTVIRSLNKNNAPYILTTHPVVFSKVDIRHSGSLLAGIQLIIPLDSG